MGCITTCSLNSSATSLVRIPNKKAPNTISGAGAASLYPFKQGSLWRNRATPQPSKSIRQPYRVSAATRAAARAITPRQVVTQRPAASLFTPPLHSASDCGGRYYARGCRHPKPLHKLSRMSRERILHSVALFGFPRHPWSKVVASPFPGLSVRLPAAAEECSPISGLLSVGPVICNRPAVVPSATLASGLRPTTNEEADIFRFFFSLHKDMVNSGR